MKFRCFAAALSAAILLTACGGSAELTKHVKPLDITPIDGTQGFCDAQMQFTASLLQKAADRGWDRDRDRITAFTAENRGWLPDYALFMALKRHFGMKPWTQWPDADIRLRRPGDRR